VDLLQEGKGWEILHSGASSGRLRIRIELKCWIQIRIEVNSDPLSCNELQFFLYYDITKVNTII
jgi:hypothetical protein